MKGILEMYWKSHEIAKKILCDLLNIHKMPVVEWVEGYNAYGVCPRCNRNVYMSWVDNIFWKADDEKEKENTETE